jgi:hypothetical protein
MQRTLKCGCKERMFFLICKIFLTKNPECITF